MRHQSVLFRRRRLRAGGPGAGAGPHRHPDPVTVPPRGRAARVVVVEGRPGGVVVATTPEQVDDLLAEFLSRGAVQSEVHGMVDVHEQLGHRRGQLEAHRLPKAVCAQVPEHPEEENRSMALNSTSGFSFISDPGKKTKNKKQKKDNSKQTKTVGFNFVLLYLFPTDLRDMIIMIIMIMSLKL